MPVHTRWLTREVAINDLQLRLTVYSLALIQIIQGFAYPANEFIKSYWFITYEAGFIRRGLAGNVLQLLADRPTLTDSAIAGYVVAALSLVPVLLLVELLVRQRSTPSRFMALLVVASPFVLDQLAFQRRPDQLGFAVLTILAIALVRRSANSIVLTALAGASFAVICLVHEGVALYYVPFAVTIAWAAIPQMTKSLAALLLAAPSAVVCAFVLTLQPTAAAADALRARNPFPADADTMFDFLDDDAADSVLGIRDYSTTAIIAMVTLGVALIALHIYLARSQSVTGVFTQLRTRTSPIVTGVATAGVALGFAATFTLGVDWTRWFNIFGACWMITTAVLVLQDSRSKNTSEFRLPAWTIAVLAYLAILTPLAESLGTKQALFYPFQLVW